MSNDPEPRFKRRHRERAEKEREREDRRKQSESENQQTEWRADLRHLVSEAIAQINRNSQEQNSRRNEKRLLDWGTLFFLMLTTGLTGLTYRVFYEQLEETRADAAQQHGDTLQALQKTDAANTILQKQLRGDQRARVAFGPKLDSILIRPGEPVTIEIGLANMGKTVARRITGYVMMERLKPPEEPNVGDDFQLNGWPNYRRYFSLADLLPNQPGQRSPYDMDASWLQVNPHTRLTEPVNATRSDVDDYNKGKIYFAIYGRIAYRDIYNIDHWTRFCGIFTKTGITVPAPAKCTKYNDVDEQDE